MNFDSLLCLEEFHSQVDAPLEQVEIDQIITLSGQSNKIDLGVRVDPEVVLMAEMNFSPAVTGTQLISLDYWEIDHAFFIS
ncbi:hypothetical protein ACFLT9_09385 [Acidobacteriota bacterium]